MHELTEIRSNTADLVHFNEWQAFLDHYEFRDDPTHMNMNQPVNLRIGSWSSNDVFVAEGRTLTEPFFNTRSLPRAGLFRSPFINLKTRDNLQVALFLSRIGEAGALELKK